MNPLFFIVKGTSNDMVNGNMRPSFRKEPMYLENILADQACRKQIESGEAMSE